jgi:membrane associated rhomboid family serine protease
LGDLGNAALLVAAVDSGPAGQDPTLIPLVQRARLLLLAYAGADLEPLLSTVTLLHPEETANLIRLSRARALAGPAPDPRLEALLRGETARAAEALRVRPRRPLPATWTLIGLNLVCFLAVMMIPGGADVLSGNGDLSAPLARAGALIRPAVLAGEWWRLVAAMFLHAGWLHILSNMYGLLILGRFVENLVGGPRMVVIYFIGGLCGSLASALLGKGLSVGASGAILGLLGALLVLVLLRRASLAERWRRILLWNLVLVTVVQIGIGFFTSMIDNAAHIGGLLGGAAATLVFAPGLLVGDGRAGRALVRLFAAACVALSLITLVQVVRTPLSKTLARIPQMTITLQGVQLSVPSDWVIQDGKLIDPYLDIEVAIDHGRVVSSVESDPRYAELLQRIRASARPAP